MKCRFVLQPWPAADFKNFSRFVLNSLQMTKKEFKKRLSEIIDKDFNGLRKPDIFFVKRKDLFMATLKLPFLYILFVDKEALEMNDKAVTGCLVHELCHMVHWNFRDDEREIDQMVIDKGYGWELYEFLKYHDSIYEKYSKKDGLTKKEVLRQLKSGHPNNDR